MNKCNCRMSPLALGLSLGVLWGLSLLIIGLIAFYSSYGQPFVVAVGSLYMGYEPSIMGSVIGAVIGFIDAFIGGVLIAALYNLFGGCGCGCCTKEVSKGKK